MHTVGNLAQLERAATRRLANIEARLLRYDIPPTSEQERGVALCLIDAQSTWSQFARFFFVSSVLGARRGGGAYTTVTVGGLHTAEDAITFAILTFSPKRKKRSKFRPLDEPPWHKGSILPRLAQAVGLSNQAQVNLAFSIQARALEDLPIARNFFAHRSRDTAALLEAIAPRYGLPDSTRAGALPGHLDPRRPHSIAAGWVAELRAIVRHIGL